MPFTRYRREYYSAFGKREEHKTTATATATATASGKDNEDAAVQDSKQQAITLVQNSHMRMKERIEQKRESNLRHVRMNVLGVHPGASRGVAATSLHYESALDDTGGGGVNDADAFFIHGVQTCSSIFSTNWSKQHKGFGVAVRSNSESEKAGRAYVAVCNQAHERLLPCGVRAVHALPKTGQTYFEIAITRANLKKGSTLEGSYAIGLCTDQHTHFEALWLNDTNIMQIQSLYLLLAVTPAPYNVAWSARWKASVLQISALQSSGSGFQAGNGKVATYVGKESSTSALGSPAAKRRKSVYVAEEGGLNEGGVEYVPQVREPIEKFEMASMRADTPLPRGTSYFEITITDLSKAKSESLGGSCYIGLCTQVCNVYVYAQQVCVCVYIYMHQLF
jgi:hypothetical protein